MIILAIDTSDERGSVAVREKGHEQAFVQHQTDEDYSSWILPAVDSIFRKTGGQLADVDILAVSTGPGSFTGLRVGLTTAKAWAEVYRKPVVGIGRLEAMAAGAGGGDGCIAACYDAHRGHLFGGIYRREGGELKLLESEMVVAPEQFLEVVTEVCKAGAVRWVSLDPELITGLTGWVDREKAGDTMLQCRPNIASSIAELGEKRARESRFTDALLLDANYVRRSDAETFWKDPLSHGH